MSQPLLDPDPFATFGTTAPDEPKRGRLVDRIDPWAVRLLTVLGFGLPAIGYFYLLKRYSLNVIVGDQWDDVTVIRNSYVHFFDWGSLWAPHNENRIFFPNLIVEVLARTTHFNIQVEEYLGAVMLVAATALLIWAHKRRSPSSPWLYYCPVAVLLLSIVQWQNTLWGFQMAWYLVLLCLAACIVLLDRLVLGWIVFTCALAIAVVGSFSSLQGLIIWPVGVILLYHRRRQWSFVVAWVIVAIGSVVLYLHNFHGAAGPLPDFARQHPLDSLRFYLLLVGDITGVPLSNAHGPNNAVMLFGLVIVCMAILTVLVCGIRRDEEGPGPVGVALICYGLVFGATVTQGRLIVGYAGVGQSRYTTFELLIVVGIYMALLGRTAGRRHRAPDGSIGNVGLGVRGAWARSLAWLEGTGLTAARWALVVVIVIQVLAGLHYGPSGAKANYQYKVAGAKVLKTIDHASNSQIERYLYVFVSPSWVRMQAHYAREHHLSLFVQGGSQAVGSVNVSN